jgi:(p)ppGpp synthase/HD superfamily hydrolase
MNLERAKAIATEAHAGQVDKAGVPYISHPLRVMQAQDSEEARIVGVLHDVVEDCLDKGWTIERLRDEGFSPTVLEALRLVTKIEGEDYDDFVRRAAGNPISRAVKIADLQDNMDLSRIANVTPRDLERIEKYQRALAWLKSE